MKKALIVTTILLLLNFNTSFTYAENLNIDAESCILIDSETGQVLYEQNANARLYPASTTKIITGALAIEYGELDQMMEASQAAVYDIGKDGMNIGIMPGEILCMKDLLGALLVRSANETANIIAENICTTRQEFVDLMNQKAQELGAINTHFVNPCGAHDSNHYSTASDIAKIARYAMTLPEFREIVRMTEYSMSPTNKHSEWDTILYTTNHLLTRKTSDLFDITGMKTGYTDPAGHCLVSSAVNKDGVELIAVVLGVKNPNSKENVLVYSEQLLEYGYKNYSMQEIAIPHEVVQFNIPVIGGEEGATVNLITENGLKALLPVDKSKWNITQEKNISSLIKAPVINGEIYGQIIYKSNDLVLGKVNIIADKTVEVISDESTKDAIENSTVSSTFRRVAIGACILILCFLLLRTFLRIVSRRVNSRKYKKY
ncbi:MAG: D-alanyl-D-alanine carboxypeptidase family protein [Acetivibrionales bacterium]|jgi:D-alanyl-D-alanine carboxypeptidase (penicillin-binding protein 5/6)